MTASSDEEWQAAGDRIDTLIAASATGCRVARERAEELVRLVADLYGAGLQRTLEILHERGCLTGDALDALAGDGLLESLLLVHGLHPYPVETRDVQAHAGVRDDVELLEISDDGVVRLRVPGSGGGCQPTSATLKPAIEEAIEAAAPEVVAIEILDDAATPVIPIQSLYTRVGRST